MRIAFVLDWYCKYTAELAIAVRALDNEVLFVSRSHAHEFGGSVHEKVTLQSRLRAAGVDLLSLGGVKQPVRFLIDPTRVRAAIERWNPDLIHVQQNYDAQLLWVARGHQRVLTIHDPVPHPGAPRKTAPRRLIARQWRRGSAGIVVHGQALVRELHLSPRDPPACIISHGSPTVTTPLPAPAMPMVLMFGRLEPYKGAAVLLHAMRILWQRRPEVRLQVVGNGSDAAAFRGQAGVTIREGYFPEADIPSLLQSASVGVLPYIQASGSGVGALMVGHGIPVVVTRVGALPELAPDPHLVVPPHDPYALASAIEYALTAGPEMRAKVLRHARDQMSWATVAQRHLELYCRVLDSNHPPASSMPPAAA